MKLFDGLGIFVAVVWRGGEGGRTGLHGADALFGLGEVAFYSFLAAGEVVGVEGARVVGVVG